MGDFFFRHSILRRPPAFLLWRAGLPLLLAACRPAARDADVRIRGVDDAGDTVALAAPARRVVSLIPASTELLFAIGAGAAVEGRTRWCDYPAAAADVPDLGDGMQPSLEAILARKPDLVVLYRSPQNAAVRGALGRLGVPVVQLAIDRLEDFERDARLLGTLTGHTSGADSMLALFHARLDSATLPPAAGTPSVLILVWDQPPMTVGAGSFLSEIVVRAGGRNLFDDIPTSSATVSVESVVARNPDAVLVTGEGTPGFARRAEWQTVPAVREQRFIRVSGSAFGRPSPRAPQAILELRRDLAEFRR
jgi:ABC-type Fe3+-hydroxamate transport system substrate-binding protein